MIEEDLPYVDYFEQHHAGKTELIINSSEQSMSTTIFNVKMLNAGNKCLKMHEKIMI